MTLSTALYCICNGPEDDRFMIGCEGCNEWFHGECVGVTKAQAKKIDEWICTSCLQRRDHDSLVNENTALMSANRELLAEITRKEAQKRDLLIEIRSFRLHRIEVLDEESEDLRKQKTAMVSRTTKDASTMMLLPSKKDASTMADFSRTCIESPTRKDAATMVDFSSLGNIDPHNMSSIAVSMSNHRGAELAPDNEISVAQDFENDRNNNDGSQKDVTSTIMSFSQPVEPQQASTLKHKRHSRLSLKHQKDYQSQ